MTRQQFIRQFAKFNSDDCVNFITKHNGKRPDYGFALASEVDYKDVDLFSFPEHGERYRVYLLYEDVIGFELLNNETD